MGSENDNVQVLQDILTQFDEFYAKLQDRKRRGVDTVDELEHKANENYRKQQMQWAKELENLQHELDAEHKTESKQEAHIKTVESQIGNIKKKIAPVQVNVEEFDAALKELKTMVEEKEKEAAKAGWDKATERAQQEAHELEERSRGLRQQLETVRREIDSQAMGIADEQAAIAAAEKRIKEKRMALDKRTWDLEQEVERLGQQQQELIARIDVQFEEKLNSIKRQFEEECQAKFEEMEQRMEQEHKEQMAERKARYDNLRRILHNLDKEDSTAEIEAARRALNAAKEKAASKDRMMKERERLQRTLENEIAGRQRMRVDMDEQVQRFKELLATELERGQVEEEKNRALDEKIDNLRSQAEAFAKLLGIYREAAAPDTPSSPPQTARKRQRTARKTGKRTRAEPEEVHVEREEGGEREGETGEAGPVAQQLNMDESVMVAPVGNLILQTIPGIEGDICISFVGEKGDHVVLENKTDAKIDLDGWRMLSIKGDETLQAYTFPKETPLFSRQQLCVTFGADNGAAKGFEDYETIGWAALPMEDTRLELHSQAEGASALVAHVALSPAENTTMDMDMDQAETENQNANCRIM
eukprot:comp22967_c0_seq1/m.36477 comp22967_c0_seq1/g.36477  ORF comp22967_c0_seq1/g.36477 comp22967_c0_seq1/m.36477 type:complete len:589 (-) comp22967_c0_seq1:709-2475(-)